MKTRLMVLGITLITALGVFVSGCKRNEDTDLSSSGTADTDITISTSETISPEETSDTEDEAEPETEAEGNSSSQEAVESTETSRRITRETSSHTSETSRQTERTQVTTQATTARTTAAPTAVPTAAPVRVEETPETEAIVPTENSQVTPVPTTEPVPAETTVHRYMYATGDLQTLADTGDSHITAGVTLYNYSSYYSVAPGAYPRDEVNEFLASVGAYQWVDSIINIRDYRDNP